MPGPDQKRWPKGPAGALMGLLLALAAPLPEAAAESAGPEKLRALERAIELRKSRLKAKQKEAQELAREAAELKRRLIAAAAAVQEREAAVTRTEERLAELVADEEIVSRRLAEREAAMDATLAALQRLERNRPPALVVQPDDVVNAARSALLLGTIVPQLHSEAKSLGEELRALQTLRADILKSREELLTANRALHAEQERLEAVFEEKDAKRRRTLADAETEDRAIAKAAAEARDMRSLIAQVEARARAHVPRLKPKEPLAPRGREDDGRRRLAARPGPGSEPLPPGSGPEGRRLPAQGRVVLAFGQADGAGGSAKGVLLRTRNNAQVVSPTSGQVAFAGPVRGYGQMLIIAAPGGYHVILAGLNRIYGSEGQSLLAGEPVGTMGPEDPDQTAETASGRDARELYLEIRYKGLPVDPMQWLGGNKGTVTG